MLPEEHRELVKVTGSIVAAALAARLINADEAHRYTGEVYETLKNLGTPKNIVTGNISFRRFAEDSGPIDPAVTGATTPAIDSIGPDKITCLICGAQMRVLTKHLREAHRMTGKEYKQRFGLPKDQALAATNLSDAKRAQAEKLGLAKHLRKKPVTPAVTPDLGLD